MPRTGARNRLLRNEGNWAFTDVTAETGLDAHNTRFSFSAAWEDYDNDGDLDLYVANDFGRNNLYRNDNGYFTDAAAEAGVEDIAPGMSVTWGDYNRDGHADIYVSNMFSAAGNRIAFQDRFQPRLDTTDRALFQRHARGNSLFLSRGDGTFSDTSIASGATMGRWAWAIPFRGPEQRRMGRPAHLQRYGNGRAVGRPLKFLLAAGRVAGAIRSE